MASAVRQIVRQHKQLIKFPNRIRIHQNPTPNNSTPEISSTVAAISQRIPSLKTLKSLSAFTSANGSSASFEDAAIVSSLPQRFRRRPISQDEMEYIERGGPE